MVRVYIVAIFTALVLMLSTQRAFSLQCYSCNSATQKECADPWVDNNVVKKQLCAPATRCFKLTGKDFVARRCGPINYCDYPEAKNATSCSDCDSNLCNASSQHAGSCSLMATSILFIIAVVWNNAA